MLIICITHYNASSISVLESDYMQRILSRSGFLFRMVIMFISCVVIILFMLSWTLLCWCYCCYFRWGWSLGNVRSGSIGSYDGGVLLMY